MLASVDGARATLPVPQVGSMNGTQAQWKAAEIFDQLGTLDRYAREAGLIVGVVPGL